jgi:hypothetical protein
LPAGTVAKWDNTGTAGKHYLWGDILVTKAESYSVVDQVKRIESNSAYNFLGTNINLVVVLPVIDRQTKKAVAYFVHEHSPKADMHGKHNIQKMYIMSVTEGHFILPY